MHPEIALHMRGMWLAFAGTSLIVGILVSRLAMSVERRDRALEAMRDRNAKASRVAGLATVVAGAAHELGTPLATMAVAARELERATAHLPNVDEIRTDTALIRAEIDRCRRVLDEMAGRIAEPMGEAPESRPLDHVLASALERLPPEERGRVTQRMPDGLGVVWPVGVVSRALANLLRNAIQASASGQTVEVTAAIAAGDRVHISVVDRGRGMSAEELARAGEPFFTTKAQGVGTGLGLFVTRSAIEQLGGSVEVVSNAGQGTTATVLLPRDVTPGRT
jgi:two-component system sensor histidine kinase RegB